MKIGHGYDVHKLKAGDHVFLGGTLQEAVKRIISRIAHRNCGNPLVRPATSLCTYRWYALTGIAGIRWYALQTIGTPCN